MIKQKLQPHARSAGRMPPSSRPAQRRLPARTTGALEELGYDPEPSMKLSRAIFIVIIMHVIAVGGMYFFQHLRESRLARSAEAAGTSAALREIHTPEPVARPTTGMRIHYVEPGQSLSSIARIYGVTVDQLAKENNISDPGQIRAGQELRVPVESVERAEPLDMHALVASTPRRDVAPDEEAVLLSTSERESNPVAPERTVAPTPAAPAAPRPAPPRATKTETPKAPNKAEKNLREQFLAARGRSPAEGSMPRSQPAAGTSASPATTSTSARTYVVKKGDNPVAIARKHNVSYSALLELNNISDPRKLRVGQTLKIPAR